jgi:hypothetical protein
MEEICVVMGFCVAICGNFVMGYIVESLLIPSGFTCSQAWYFIKDVS